MSIHNEKVRHIDANLVPEWFKIERTKVLSPTEMMVEKYATTAAATAATGSTTTTTSSASASVIYWMQRDVRSVDNWALALAAHLADATSATLRVVYALPPPTTTTTRLLMEEEEEEEEDDDDESDKSTIIPDLKHLGMTERHGKFLLGGLECVHQELKQHDIPLHIVKPKDYDHVGTDVCDQVILKYHAQIVITDMSPLRHYREWTELQALPILNQNNIVFYQVDTHNIVPVWIASDKREYGARTIRPKINKQYHLYLQKFPRLEAFQLLANKNKTNVIKIPDFERQRYEEYMQMDASVKELTWCQPGTQAGLKQAEFFFANGLPKFDALRNDRLGSITVTSRSKDWPWP
jgi:deoxyribodipyrimidine photo-lyase